MVDCNPTKHTKTMNLHCIHCGSQILETASSCPNCHVLFCEPQSNETHAKDAQATGSHPSSRRTRHSKLSNFTNLTILSILAAMFASVPVAWLYSAHKEKQRASTSKQDHTSTTEIRDIHGKTLEEYSYQADILDHQAGTVGGFCGSIVYSPCFALAQENYEIRSKTTIRTPLDVQAVTEVSKLKREFERLQNRALRGRADTKSMDALAERIQNYVVPSTDTSSLFFCSEECLRAFWKKTGLPTHTTFEHKIAHKSIELEHAAYFIPDKVALYQQAALTNEKCRMLLDILTEEGSSGSLDAEWENQSLWTLFAAQVIPMTTEMWNRVYPSEGKVMRSCLASCNPGAHNSECLLTLISSEDPLAFKVHGNYPPTHNLSNLEKLSLRCMKVEMIDYFRSLDIQSAWEEYQGSVHSEKAWKLEADWKRAQRDAQQYKLFTLEEMLQEEYPNATTVGDALKYVCSETAK